MSNEQRHAWCGLLALQAHVPPCQSALMRTLLSQPCPAPPPQLPALQPLPEGVTEELLKERSAAGQAAREASLNGAVVLFVCAGYGKVRCTAAGLCRAGLGWERGLPRTDAHLYAHELSYLASCRTLCSTPRQKRFIYEKARALGVRAVLVDSPNHWGRDAVGTAFDAFHPVDLTRDTDAVLADIVGVYNRLVEVSLSAGPEWKTCAAALSARA